MTTAAGLAVGVAAGAAAAFSRRRAAALAVAGSALVGVAVQAHVHFHPELMLEEGTSIFAGGALRWWLSGAVAAVATLAAAWKSRRPGVTLLVAASALLSGAAAARLLPKDGILNVASLPLLAFLAAVLVYEAVDRKVSRRASLAVAAGLVVALPAVLTAVSAYTGITPLAVRDEPYMSDPGKAAVLVGKPDVVVIVLDTFRPDHVSALGYGRQTTPNIDAFLETSTLYARAKSASSWTLASHAAMFTGLMPRQNGAHFAEKLLGKSGSDDVRAIAYPLSPNVPMLAETLRQAGYATGGVASNYAWLGPDFGIDRGFGYYVCRPRYRQESIGNYDKIPISPMLDDFMKALDRVRQSNYSDRQPYYRASEVTSMALDWLRRRKDDHFFLFVNYWDPHSPYNPPPPYDAMFPGKVRPCGARVEWLDQAYDVMLGKADVDPAFREELISQYDGEIAYMDAWLGRLFGGMRRMGVFDDSLIILASDHGESFGEHRFLEHGVNLYEEETAALLAVKAPGQTAPRRVERPVSLVDLAPTVLTTLRMPLPRGAEARSFDDAAHDVVAELYPHQGRVEHYGERFDRHLTAIYDGDNKLIMSTKGEPEVYDLASDPREKADISGGEQALSTRLAAWDAAHPPIAPSASAVPSKATVDRLRSVGYLGR